MISTAIRQVHIKQIPTAQPQAMINMAIKQEVIKPIPQAELLNMINMEIKSGLINNVILFSSHPFGIGIRQRVLQKRHSLPRGEKFASIRR